MLIYTIFITYADMGISYGLFLLSNYDWPNSMLDT